MGNAELKIPLYNKLPPREVDWGNSWSMSELDFPLSELGMLEEGEEYFCSYMGLDTSPLRAPTNGVVLCCLLCLTSRSSETVPVRIYSITACYSLYVALIQ